MERQPRNRFLAASAAVLLLIAAAIIFGNDDNQCPPRLARIDSLMDRNPQAAYDSLLHIGSQHVYDGDKAMEMRLLMLKAKAQNKLYLPMPSDTAFNEVVEYYDSNGSANDRMLSRYLLGCIYRDKEDGKNAIRNYQEAICCADTTEDECNYYLLSCIYSQMAESYTKYNLHKYARLSYIMSIWYAKKGDYTLLDINGHETLAYLSYLEGDTVNAVKHALKTEKLYLGEGYFAESFSVYPIYIYILLERKQYAKAHSLMQKYKKFSGNFDNDGHLKPGREHYYKALGIYFLGVNNNDSAEYCFRKLQQYGFKYEAARGLCDLYAAAGCHDSVNKYNVLCEAEMDSILRISRDNKLVQGDELYDFGRIQRLLDKKYNKRATIFICLLLLICLFVFALRKSSIIENLSCLFNIGRKGHTTSNIKNSPENEENEDHNEFGILETKCDKISAVQNRRVTNEQITKIKRNDIYCKFVENSKATADKSSIEECDWIALEHKIEEAFPTLYSTLKSCHKLTKMEYNVCLLTAIGFQTLEISTILDVSKQQISNAKNMANYKIYGSHGARLLFANLKEEMER